MNTIGAVALIMLIIIEAIKMIIPNKLIKGHLRNKYIVGTVISIVLEIVIIVWLFYNRFVAKDMLTGSTSITSFLGCVVIIGIIIGAQILDIKNNIKLRKEEVGNNESMEEDVNV